MVNIGVSFPPKVTHICCIGAGYVGGPTSAVMAAQCPDIRFTVADTDSARIAAWNSSNLPVYEKGLDDLVKMQRSVNLFFTTDVDSAIRQAEMILIAVNTPTKTRGVGSGQAADLRNVEMCVRRIATAAETDKVVVERSTVPCGTGQMVASILDEFAKPGVRFHVLSNPEFMSEGSAIANLLHPDRVIIGAHGTSQWAQGLLRAVYEQWVPRDRILTMDLWSAELSKLAANAMLAQRISSINAISAVCEAAGASVKSVADGVGSDRRIGRDFLDASVGFGGSCFHKDVASLVWLSQSLNLPEIAEYWSQVLAMNSFQISRFARTVSQTVVGGLEDKRIACLGFAYKSGTGDSRNTPAAEVCRYLLDEGAHLAVYDPKVPDQHIRDRMEELGCDLSQVSVCASAEEAADGAQAVVVLTAWKQFLALDWEIVYGSMAKPAYVFDGQLMLEPETMRRLGYHFYQIGHPRSP